MSCRSELVIKALSNRDCSGGTDNESGDGVPKNAETSDRAGAAYLLSQIITDRHQRYDLSARGKNWRADCIPQENSTVFVADRR